MSKQNSVTFLSKEGKAYSISINGEEYQLSGLNLFKDTFKPLPLKLKGSTLGWNTKGRFISFKSIRKAIVTASIVVCGLSSCSRVEVRYKTLYVPVVSQDTIYKLCGRCGNELIEFRAIKPLDFHYKHLNR